MIEEQGQKQARKEQELHVEWQDRFGEMTSQLTSDMEAARVRTVRILFPT